MVETNITVYLRRAGYCLAPPFWRRLFGAELLWHWDVLALGCFASTNQDFPNLEHVIRMEYKI